MAKQTRPSSYVNTSGIDCLMTPRVGEAGR